MLLFKLWNASCILLQYSETFLKSALGNSLEAYIWVIVDELE